MGINNKQATIVHSLSDANFTNNAYFKVLSLADTQVSINSGTTFTLAKDVVLDIPMTSISAATPANIVVMGCPKPYDSVNSYDIQTGNPIT